MLIGKKKPATLPWKGSSKSPAMEPKENGFLTQTLEERTLTMEKSSSMKELTQSGNLLALEVVSSFPSQLQTSKMGLNLCATRI